jgi:hypothetical protein
VTRHFILAQLKNVNLFIERMPGRAETSPGKDFDRALSGGRRSQIVVRWEKGEQILGRVCYPQIDRSPVLLATHTSPRRRSVYHADALSVDIQPGVGRYTGAFRGKRW